MSLWPTKTHPHIVSLVYAVVHIRIRHSFLISHLTQDRENVVSKCPLVVSWVMSAYTAGSELHLWNTNPAHEKNKKIFWHQWNPTRPTWTCDLAKLRFFFFFCIQLILFQFIGKLSPRICLYFAFRRCFWFYIYLCSCMHRPRPSHMGNLTDSFLCCFWSFLELLLLFSLQWLLCCPICIFNVYNSLNCQNIHSQREKRAFGGIMCITHEDGHASVSSD